MLGVRVPSAVPTVSPFKDSPFLFNTKTFNGIIRTLGWGVIRWKRKINSELFSLLLESKNNFRALGHCLTDHPESTELFNQNLGKFNFGIRKLLDYYNDYSFYLSNYSSIIQRLESTYNEYIAFGRSHLTLNNESRQQLQDYINTLFKLICNASERYIKEI